MGTIKLSARIKQANLRFSERATREATLIVLVASKDVAQELIDYMTEYPPEGPGNAPPYPYWERGTGRVHKSGTVDPRSEKYGASWQMTNKRVVGGGEAIAWTNVTYAPYLADPNRQARFHAANGWRTTDDALRHVGAQGVSTYGTAILTESSPVVRSALEKVRNVLSRVFGGRGR